jgi:hypothetical protein
MSTIQTPIEIVRNGFGTVQARNSNDQAIGGCAIILTESGVKEISDLSFSFYPKKSAYVGGSVFIRLSVYVGVAVEKNRNLSGWSNDIRDHHLDDGIRIFDNIYFFNQSLDRFLPFGKPLITGSEDKVSVVCTFVETDGVNLPELFLNVNGCIRL